MNLLNCKKGQLQDGFAVIIFILFFAFIILTAFVIHNEMITAWQGTSYYTGAVQETGDKFTEAWKVFDYVIVLVVALLIASAGWASFRLRTSPIGFMITFIGGIFLGFVSFFFNYIFVQIVSLDVYSSILVYFPRTLILGTNMHWVALISLIVSSLALFGKKRGDEQLLG
jgi:hypothetical protein